MEKLAALSQSYSGESVSVTSSFYAGPVTERGLVLVRAESMARANPEPVSGSQYWTGVYSR